jgi:hypothetical protein
MEKNNNIKQKTTTDFSVAARASFLRLPITLLMTSYLDVYLESGVVDFQHAFGFQGRLTFCDENQWIPFRPTWCVALALPLRCTLANLQVNSTVISR